MTCKHCGDTGIIETGNNDLPCEACEVGKTALFNVGDRTVRGEELLMGEPSFLHAQLAEAEAQINECAFLLKCSPSDVHETLLERLRELEAGADAIRAGCLADVRSYFRAFPEEGYSEFMKSNEELAAPWRDVRTLEQVRTQLAEAKERLQELEAKSVPELIVSGVAAANEIKRLSIRWMEVTAHRDQVLQAAERYLTEMGACEFASEGGDSSLCAHSECSYCTFARAVQPGLYPPPADEPAEDGSDG